MAVEHNANRDAFDFQAPTAIYDVDGTLTGHGGGGAGSVLIPDNNFLADGSDVRPTGWDARISDDLYANFRFEFDGNNQGQLTLVAPDGDSDTESSNSSHRTIIKANNEIYTIGFPSGPSSYEDGFEILYRIQLGDTNPASITESSIIRFQGVADSVQVLESSNRFNGQDQTLTTQVATLSDLESIAGPAYWVDGNDLVVKFVTVAQEWIRYKFTPGSNTPIDPPSGDVVNVSASDDAYIENTSTLNNTLLRIESSGNRTRTSYLKFNVPDTPGKTIIGVTLRLTVSDDAGNNMRIRVYESGSDNWTEGNLIPGNAPPKGALLDDITGNFVIGQVYSFDVSASVAAGEEVTFVIDSDGAVSSGDAAFASSENGNTAIRPQLVVSTAATPVIEGRHIFYAGSSFDDGSGRSALATDKTALRSGETATSSHYTSYLGGINGIIIDARNLAGTPTRSDFVFRVVNDNTPDNWTTLGANSGAVSFTPGAGEDGSDQIMITWDSATAIKNQWLQVTMLANSNTGLSETDVFYFGNQVADVFGTTQPNEHASTNAFDAVFVRLNQSEGQPVAVENDFDIDRNGMVNAFDTIWVRLNQMHNGLLMLQVPETAGGSQQLVAAGQVLEYQPALTLNTTVTESAASPVPQPPVSDLRNTIESDSRTAHVAADASIVERKLSTTEVSEQPSTSPFIVLPSKTENVDVSRSANAVESDKTNETKTVSLRDRFTEMQIPRLETSSVFNDGLITDARDHAGNVRPEPLVANRETGLAGSYDRYFEDLGGNGEIHFATTDFTQDNALLLDSAFAKDDKDVLFFNPE